MVDAIAGDAKGWQTARIRRMHYSQWLMPAVGQIINCDYILEAGTAARLTNGKYQVQLGAKRAADLVLPIIQVRSGIRIKNKAAS